MDKSFYVQPKGMEVFNRFPIVWYGCKGITVKHFPGKDFLSCWFTQFGTQKENCPVWDYWKKLRFKSGIIEDPCVLGLLCRCCVLLVLNGD